MLLKHYYQLYNTVPENLKIALVWDLSHEVPRKKKYTAEKKIGSLFHMLQCLCFILQIG